MATAEWAGRKREYVEVEKETIGLEEREKTGHVGRKVSKAYAGERAHNG